jgi:hypothetical protein
MRPLLSAVIAVVATAAVLSASSTAGRSASVPTLTVATMRPFVVVGTGFQARETVRVAVSSDDGYTAKRATASAAGKLIVRFVRLKVDRCSEFVVAAHGAEGSSARVHRLPPPCGIDPRPAP